MISLISGLYKWIFAEREGEEVRLLLLGLDGSGKTTFLECIKSSFKGGGQANKKKKISLQSSSSSLSSSSVSIPTPTPPSFSFTKQEEQDGKESRYLSSLDEEKKTKRRSGYCSSSSSFHDSSVKTYLSIHEDKNSQAPYDKDLLASFSPSPSSSSLSQLSLSSSSSPGTPPPPSSSSLPSSSSFSLPCVHSTTGFNFARVKVDSDRIVIWDLGGRETLQSIWREYLQDAHSILFFVDISDRERLKEARRAFFKLCDDLRERQAIQRSHPEKKIDHTKDCSKRGGRSPLEARARKEEQESQEEKNEEEEEEKSGVDDEREMNGEGRSRDLGKEEEEGDSSGRRRREEEENDDGSFLLRHLLSTSVPPIFLVANKQDSHRGMARSRGNCARRTAREGRRGVSPRVLLSFFHEGDIKHGETHAKKRRSIGGGEDSGDQERNVGGREEEKIREEEEEESLDRKGVKMGKEIYQNGVKKKNGYDDDVEDTPQCGEGRCRREGERREEEEENKLLRRNGDEGEEEKKKKREERHDSMTPVRDRHADGGKKLKKEEEWVRGMRRNEEEEEEEEKRIDGEEERKFDEKERFLGRGMARGIPFWCIGSSAYDESSVQTLLRCAVETAKLLKQLRKERKEEERQARALPRPTTRRRTSTSSARSSDDFSSPGHESYFKPNALSSSSLSPSMIGLGAGEREQEERDRMMSPERWLDRKMKEERNPSSVSGGFDRLSSSSSAPSTTWDLTSSSFSSSSSSLSPSISTHPSSVGPSSSSSSSPSPSPSSSSSPSSASSSNSSSSSFPFVTNHAVSHSSSFSIPVKSLSPEREKHQADKEERKTKDRRSLLQASSSSPFETSDKAEHGGVLLSPGNTSLAKCKEEVQGEGENCLFFSAAPETERKIDLHRKKKDGEKEEQGDRLIFGDGVMKAKKGEKVGRRKDRGGEEENSDRSLVCENRSLLRSERTSSSLSSPRHLPSPGERSPEGGELPAIFEGRRRVVLGERRDGKEEENKKKEKERKEEDSSEGLYDIEDALENIEDFFATRLSLTTRRISRISSYPLSSPS
ncbi:adp-ribosylation factor [Cystoisospora suis]|uniref:Adp-ribosylation factor n=1 Tax=Cystoisospora suis TaxID=483139 RepID=A0A2C6KZS2_9APIC|nr:adp-ribosylation factor [Cystoisospora suis]